MGFFENIFGGKEEVEEETDDDNEEETEEVEDKEAEVEETEEEDDEDEDEGIPLSEIKSLSDRQLLEFIAMSQANDSEASDEWVEDTIKEIKEETR